MSKSAAQAAQCTQCLIPEGVALLSDFFAVSPDTEGATRVQLNAEGLCQYCVAYRQHYDKQQILRELKWFVDLPTEGDFNAIVAVSGGKDSISALFLAKEVLGLKVFALTYDNGFIPEKVLDQTRRIYETLEVPYRIVRHPLYEAFKKEYQVDEKGQWQAQTGLDFCQVCSKQMGPIMADMTRELQCPKLIFGNRIYSRLHPYVSSLSRHRIGETQFYSINFLFALQLKAEEQGKILRDVGWTNPQLPGDTSNCLVPGFVEAARRRKLGFASETGYLERELRSGTLTLEQARQEIADREVEDMSAEISAFFAH